MINTELIKTIKILKKASKTKSQKIWAALADDLDKPKRIRVAVNLSQINRHSKPDDIVAVPGKILASGALEHSLTIAAYSFSEGALEKIEHAKGKAVSLTSLLDDGVEPSKIKIIK